MRLTIYVPRTGGLAESMLAPGSAIVGDPGRGGEGSVLCHYEDAIHGQINMPDFFSRLLHAAGRMTTGYPTSAMAAFEEDDLVPVGIYDGDRSVVLEITNPEALRDWCGEEAEAVLGRRLPVGRAEWDAAAAVAQPPHAHPVGASDPGSLERWFKTQAGQLVRFDVVRREAEVHDHDDPALPGLLADLRLSADEMRRAIGSAAGAALTP